jgi:hypothetical protein
MIWYLKDPKKFYQKSYTINSFSKVAGYKINLQKSVAFLDHQQWTDWERIYENNSIYNRLKKIKYLGIILTKDIITFTRKTTNHSRKKSKKIREYGKITMLMDWPKQHSTNDYTTKIFLHV